MSFFSANNVLKFEMESALVTHGIDGGVGVDLQRVDIVTGVLEQAVIWVQHLMGQQVQPLPAQRDM